MRLNVIDDAKRDLAALLLLRKPAREDAIAEDELFRGLRKTGHRQPDIAAAVVQLREEKLIEQGTNTITMHPDRSLISQAPEGVFLTRDEPPEPQVTEWRIIWALPALQDWWEDQQFEPGDLLGRLQLAVARIIKFVNEPNSRGADGSDPYLPLLALDQRIGALCQAIGISVPPIQYDGTYLDFTLVCKVPIMRTINGTGIWPDLGWTIAMEALRQTARLMNDAKKREALESRHPDKESANGEAGDKRKRSAGQRKLEESGDPTKQLKANLYDIVKKQLEESGSQSKAKAQLKDNQDFAALAQQAKVALNNKRDWKNLFDAARLHFDRRRDETQ